MYILFLDKYIYFNFTMILIQICTSVEITACIYNFPSTKMFLFPLPLAENTSM